MLQSSPEVAVVPMLHGFGVSEDVIQEIMVILRRGSTQEKAKRLIRTNEARILLGQNDGKPVSKQYLKGLVAKGMLKEYRRTARKIYYDRDEILAFLAMEGKYNG